MLKTITPIMRVAASIRGLTTTLLQACATVKRPLANYMRSPNNHNSQQRCTEIATVWRHLKEIHTQYACKLPNRRQSFPVTFEKVPAKGPSANSLMYVRYTWTAGGSITRCVKAGTPPKKCYQYHTVPQAMLRYDQVLKTGSQHPALGLFSLSFHWN